MAYLQNKITRGYSMKSIWNKVDSIAKKIAEKKENTINQPQEKNLLTEDSHDEEKKLESDKEIYLPISKKSQIPVPNGVLRSALFGVIAKGSRKFEKSVLKATINGYSVKYTGEQLDQSDLDVWIECLRRCQKTALGHIVKCSSYEFLRAINRNTGKSDHEWLKSVFLRLRVNDIEISDGKYTYAGSLIFEHYRAEDTGENCIILNPKIADCFVNSCWTGIDIALRLQFKGKPLTQWLFGFYATHAKPLPIKVETLKQLCGSQISELKKFKQILKKSLCELSDITGWLTYIDDNEKVIIKKVVKKK